MRKLRYLVPNSFTALSLVLGLAAVGCASRQSFTLAAWMVLWGVLLDKLDGTAARLLKASSAIGAQLDSFADFVVFGIAPASLFYFRLSEIAAFGQGALRVLLLVATAVYVLAVAVRLARFNVTDPPLGDRIFYGFPTTLMGGLLAAWFLTWEKYQLSEQLIEWAPAYLIAGAVLMVSTIRLPKLKVRRSLAVNIFQFANVLAAYILAPLRLMPEYLLSLPVIYIIVGVSYYLIYPPEAAAEEKEAQQEPA